ncbi:MAG TPA: CopD family protein [Jatrophihabitantaceae bacterium]|nr:CopD family protein [Jatrophihabitantaceae bacterium]
MLIAGAPVFGSAAKTAYVGARDVEYASTALFYGGLVFLSTIWPKGTRVHAVRRLLIGTWATGTIATTAAIGLEGAWITQRSPSAAFHAAVLRSVLDTDFGAQWSAKALLWVLALIVLADLLRRGEDAVRSLPWRVGAVAVGLGTLRIDGLTGHASDAARPVVTELADLTHLAAISIWVGGLVMLLVGVLPRRDAVELQAIVPRYSQLAMASVAVAATSGTVLAWRLLDNAGQLTSTTWGHLLLLKVSLLAVVMGVAAGSRTWVRHRLDAAVILRGDAAVVRPFVLSVAAETAIVTTVLAVAGLLTTADLGR